MDAKQIKQLKPVLNKHLRQFDDSFGRIEPTERLKAYITGQLCDLQGNISSRARKPLRASDSSNPGESESII